MNFSRALSRHPLVSILIVVLEDDGRLQGCLAALQQHLPPAIPVEIVVVLCRFGRDAVQTLRTAASGVVFFASQANLGMAGGMNMARSLAGGTLLVALHDDATVQPGWLEALVAAAERHPQAGAIGSMALQTDGSVQNAGSILWANGLTSPTWVGRPRPMPEEMRAARPVDYCGTASLLVRADAFDAIGGCDEAFYPAYYVDVNIALGLRQLGRYVLSEPASRVIHAGGGSATLRYRQFMSTRNRVKFLAKWADMLPQFEPQPQSTETVLAGVEGALARAAAFAEGCVAAAAALPTAGDLRVFDVADQQRRHFAMEDALRRDYIALLEQQVETAEARVAALEAAPPT